MIAKTKLIKNINPLDFLSLYGNKNLVFICLKYLE